jgi:hypothetical protein
LNWLRSKAYIDFFESLDQDGGFFYERWGDAPVHSIAAGLMLPKDQIHFFNDIAYYHVPFTHCPTGEKHRQDLKCHCNPKDNFDWKGYSCTFPFGANICNVANLILQAHRGISTSMAWTSQKGGRAKRIKSTIRHLTTSCSCTFSCLILSLTQKDGATLRDCRNSRVAKESGVELAGRNWAVDCVVAHGISSAYTTSTITRC